MVQVGFIKKAHGLAGELKVAVEPKYLEDVLKADAVFVELRGQKIPLFIEKIRDAGGEALVKFEEVDDRTEAEGYQSKPIFLKEEDILADDEREIEVAGLEFARLEGWVLKDETLGKIGPILRVEEFPSGEMAVVNRGGAERLVPLVPVFIKKLDENGRVVEMDLPEGLLD